jgi:DNA mismatch repair protein MutL
MNRIKIMSLDLASKIAAGEVVQNPASVVKELVENAIDAQASNINIKLIDSGLHLIEILDNGVGMSKDDLILSVKEHATSKIETEYDLFSIASLGFRGEALASIKSVSKLIIASNNGDQGYTYDLVNGKVVEGYAIKGTKVSVYNLFYNVPARYKYLQTATKELSKIVEIVNRFALNYPNIAFSLSNDDKIILSTNGNGDLLQVVNQVYSLDMVKNLEYVNNENVDFSIDAYLSNEKYTKANKNYINIFINKRLVYNKELTKAIINAYGDYLMERRYPIVIMNIQCDYQLVDVNVHPAKLEVRISKTAELINLIEECIVDHFQIKRNEFIDKKEYQQTKLDFTYKIDNSLLIADENVVENTHDILINDIPIKSETDIDNSDLDSDFLKEDNDNDEVVQIQTNYIETRQETKKVTDIFFKVIGQYDDSYIIASSLKGLHLIDQHAAAERINYEKMKSKSLSYINQELITPIIIKLSYNERVKVGDAIDVLNNLGLFFEDSINNDLIFRSIPSWLDIEKAYETIEQILEYIYENKQVNVKQIQKDELILAACKMSLKANKRLSILQQQTLVNELALTDNYDHCPHGRPIIITFNNYQLEKMFKRVI